MIYLSGAITSHFRQGKNIDRFYAKANELRELGIEIYNPVENEELGKTWEEYLAQDLKWIFENKPDMYFMKNWRKSSGARLEHKVAELLGVKIVYEV